jgi:hypothetical protein
MCKETDNAFVANITADTQPRGRKTITNTTAKQKKRGMCWRKSVFFYYYFKYLLAILCADGFDRDLPRRSIESISFTLYRDQSIQPRQSLYAATRTDSLRRHISVRGGTKTWTGKRTEKYKNKMNNRIKTEFRGTTDDDFDLSHRLFLSFSLKVFFVFFCFSPFSFIPLAVRPQRNQWESTLLPFSLRKIENV